MSAESSASASASATEVNNSTTAAAPASFDDHKEAAKPLASASASASVSSTSTSTSTYHDLYLKPGHILTERHPSLAPLPPQTSDSRDGRGNGNGKQKQKQKKNRHKKNVKNSFKRGREQTLSDMKVCKSLMVGEPCAFGKDCKYSHDMKEMLSIREEDIQEVQGGCPRFHQFGNCPYGLSCRVGACHLNLATGENLTKEMNEAYEDSIKNHVSYEIMTKLRKDMYPFVCKRYQKGQKKKRNNDRNAEKEAEKAKAEVEAEAKEAAQDGSLDVGEHKKEEAPKVPDADAAEDPAPAPVDVSPLPKAEEEAKEAEADGSHHVGEHKKEEVHVPKVPDADADAAEDPAPVDLSPLPNKIRKLIDFRNKVYVAPLTTVGNLPFRRIMKKYGADITCGEMAVAQSLLQGRNGEWALLKRHKDEDVFGVQIAAGHGDVYERISEVIKNEGIEIDFLDMNLGCPIDLICKTGAGAKMMQRDRSLKEAIDGMGKNLSCPITIKIRTGWDEKKPFAHKLVPKIQRWGMGHVGTVMLHGRSRLQRYSKLADWDYIQKVADAQSDEFEKLPIIGNGDIFSFVDYEEKVLKHKDLSPTAMIGRGALIKPWLPTEIKERRHWDISATERLDILKEFVKFGLEHWGSDTHGVNNTRRFLLEWLSFLYRYVPVGLLEARSIPQEMNQRPPRHMCGRSDLETLMMSEHCEDWIKISEMLLGKVREGFDFQPKHKANSYK